MSVRGKWRMADVIWVDGGASSPKVTTLFQLADVGTGVINWVNADLVTHIVPRWRTQREVGSTPEAA